MSLQLLLGDIRYFCQHECFVWKCTFRAVSTALGCVLYSLAVMKSLSLHQIPVYVYGLACSDIHDGMIGGVMIFMMA
jgi:hypothetical protein